MSVEFDQENSFDKKFERTIANKKGSQMNAFLIKHYFAKNEKQANVILLSVSLIAIILTVVILNVSVFGGSLFNKKTLNQNAKIIQEYKKQGLTGKALMDKIRIDTEAGILK